MSSVKVKKVILGMSGGVDSSVAAHLLQTQGFYVEGLFMKNWEEDDGTEYCTAIRDLEDAQSACERFGIQLHIANFSAEYWDNVFAEFLLEYQRGRTPNPDVLCNREIKFNQFAHYAEMLGGDFIATGHYAMADTSHGEYRLMKALDRNKDQTYFLQAVPREQLRKCLFPLGDYRKPRVRELAVELGLANHDKKDSTGICFIGERRFADFLGNYIEDLPGPITDLQGRVLGEHPGLHYYTLGQRQGINLCGIRGRPDAPWYVVAKDVTPNVLVVSQDTCDLNGTWLRASQPNWLHEVTLPYECAAKIRYRQQDQRCTISQAADGQLLVRFRQPQRAIAPGQYVAFYTGDVLLGGARIEITDNGLRGQI